MFLSFLFILPLLTTSDCENHCGAFVYSSKCWCDVACAYYNDCCFDYQRFCWNHTLIPDEICNAGLLDAIYGSCENRCGESGNSTICSCQYDCMNSATCCCDLISVCPTFSPTISPSTSVPSVSPVITSFPSARPIPRHHTKRKRKKHHKKHRKYHSG